MRYKQAYMQSAPTGDQQISTEVEWNACHCLFMKYHGQLMLTKTITNHFDYVQ